MQSSHCLCSLEQHGVTRRPEEQEEADRKRDQVPGLDTAIALIGNTFDRNLASVHCDDESARAQAGCRCLVLKPRCAHEGHGLPLRRQGLNCAGSQASRTGMIVLSRMWRGSPTLAQREAALTGCARPSSSQSSHTGNSRGVSPSRPFNRSIQVSRYRIRR